MLHRFKKATNLISERLTSCVSRKMNEDNYRKNCGSCDGYHYLIDLVGLKPRGV